MSEDVTENNTSDNLVPSIFVDKNLLECNINSNKDTSKYFIIDDKRFEDELRMPDNDNVQFQMFATKRCEMAENFFFGDQDDEEYCWTPDESSDDEVLTNEPTLDLDMQTTSRGVIIDSNVYLTHYQWNAIIIEDDIAQCAMCNVYMVLDGVPEHLASGDHKRKLNCYKPLAKFDLSVTRKIRNSYHCAVCNTTFDLDKVNSHNDSEEHTNYLLSAINKVSDVMNKDSFHNRNNKNDQQNLNNDMHNDNNSFNEIKTSDSDDGDNEDNCDDDSNNPEWPVDDCHMPGPSYRDMVKKPAIALPEYLDIVVKNRSVKVKFNSWHMLITPKPNRFYCMLCKDYDFISRRAQHCGAPEHLGYLNSCMVVAKFENHLVRQVDHLFHCGHCNSLQFANHIEDHLESNHPQKTRMLSGSSSASDHKTNDDKDILTKNVVQPTITKSNDSNSNDNVLSKSDAGNRNNDTNGNGNDDLPITELHVVLNIFNCQMKVPILNYNCMQTNAGSYYCSLCQFVCPKELVVAHIQSIIHIQFIQTIPYIVQLIYNLIRPIRGYMHCTLCNIFVPPTMIYLHVQEPSHINQLHKALAMTTATANDKNQTTSTNKEENGSNEKLSTFGNGNNDISPTLGSKNNLNPTSTSNSALVTDAKSNNDLSAFEANDGATTNEDILNDSIESVTDLDSYVYVKIAKVYLKIDVMSYNTLVVVGDGRRRYCLVCSTKIGFEELKKHIKSRGHQESLNECIYVDLYEGSLLRQMHSLYHCGTCNVLLTRKIMKYHVAWSTHTEEWETAKSVPKNVRKNAIKSGIPLIVATPQKETLNLQEDLPKCKVLYKVRVTRNDRKHKIVMINDDVFKISFDHWHGVVTRAKSVLTCVICQNDITDVTRHTGTRSHLECLNKPFKADYKGELLREINKTTLHCIPCNAEVANTNQVVFKHVDGKKHKKMYQAIKEFSTNSDSYIDCEDDILQL